MRNIAGNIIIIACPKQFIKRVYDIKGSTYMREVLKDN